MCYFGDFTCVNDVIREFCVESELFVGIEILHAFYSYEEYEGTAFVLFRQDEKLYEVHGSHCSCYGLEEQWHPEETFAEALLLQYWRGKGFVSEAEYEYFISSL